MPCPNTVALSGTVGEGIDVDTGVGENDTLPVWVTFCPCADTAASIHHKQLRVGVSLIMVICTFLLLLDGFR